jgi:hypothetical protein
MLKWVFSVIAEGPQSDSRAEITQLVFMTVSDVLIKKQNLVFRTEHFSIKKLNTW